MAASGSEAPFWSDNLQESIQAAGQQARVLLCFVNDESEVSATWSNTIMSDEFREKLQSSTTRLRLRKDSQDFGFLNAICPIQSAPALVLINNGQIEAKFESPDVSEEQLKRDLTARFGTTDVVEEEPVKTSKPTSEQCLEFEPSTGRMRLPNNAYDSLRERTERLRLQKIAPKSILVLQLRLLDNIPTMKSHVQAIRSRQPGTTPVLSDEVISRLLNTPASMLQPGSHSESTTAPTASSHSQLTPDTNVTPNSSTAPSPPPVSTTSIPITEHASSTSTYTAPSQTESHNQPQQSSQQAQRADYLKQQREREASQRAERERIKEQIKRDREERRRLETVRKEGELATLRQANSTTSAPSSRDIRIQVRTFDGSTLRTTFAPTATISADIRPWIDGVNTDANRAPYNLKIILAPLPNRNIEAGEEEQTLPDLGIVGSATLVMVPIQGFVSSYAGASTSVTGSVIGGLIGAGGSVVNGVLGMLGWGGTETASSTAATTATSPATQDDTTAESRDNTIKVRTLADQRAEERKRTGNQLYNGNSLDFQGRKDDDDDNGNREKD